MFVELMPLLKQRTLLITVARVDDKVKVNVIPAKVKEGEEQALTTSFTYNGVKLPDPDPRITPEEVKPIYYSHQYPELATAAVTGPEIVEEHLRYSFVRAIGTKG